MRSMTKLLAPLLALSAPVLALAAPGCSFVVEAEDQQCSTDADCTALGASFEGTFCNSQSVCQKIESYCFSNAECQQRTGSTSYICRQSDHTCLDLLTQECPKLLADPGDLLSDPPPLILGHHGFASTAPPLLAGENALDMARDEFKKNANGLPGASPPRPVVIVSCDSNVMSPEQHKLANDHLIKEIGVPILFGPVPASWAAYTLPVARENDVLVLTAGADTIDETSSLRQGLLFRNNFSQAKSSEATALLVEKVLEPKVRAEKALTADQPIRVAMVYSDEGASTTSGQLFFQSARFNGKTAAENGDNYKQFNMGSVTSPDFTATLAQAVLQMKQFQPHVVVIYDGNATDEAIVQMESEFPGLAHYVLGPAGAEQPLIDAFGNDETKRRRIWVMQSGQPSSNVNYGTFLRQYSATYPMLPGGQVAGIIGAPQYDQYYLAMYALAALGTTPGQKISGAALGDILLKRFNSGTEIQMGPLKIDDAVSRLQRGESIVYRGAATSSKFNANGDVSTPTLVVCISKDQQAQSRFIETGIYIDADTNEFIGTDNCN
jgi:hypothetical protein